MQRVDFCYTEIMASKKKRNKRYRGQDAATVRPHIVRVTAADRNKLQQWWFERKKFIKPVAIALAVVIFIVLCIVELVTLIT